MINDTGTDGTRILLIRHGHSVANRDLFFGGNTDVDLTEIGIRQAEKVRDFVLSCYKVDAVYASDLMRAWKTAACIAAPLGLPVTQDARLREINGGDWEKLPFSVIEKDYPEQFRLWRAALHLVEPPHGETAADIQRRGAAAVNDIAARHPGQTVVIVAHRVILRTLQCIWEKKPLDRIMECDWLSNCSVCELLIRDGEWIPVNIGQDAFMGDDITAVNSTM